MPVQPAWPHLCAHLGAGPNPVSSEELMEVLGPKPIAKAPAERFTGDVYVDSIYRGGATVLVEALRAHTRESERCWFAVWAGYAWV